MITAKDVFVRKAGASITFARLNTFINANEPKLAKMLVNLWNNQGNAITYKEIREALLNGDLTETMISDWQQDYSKFVVEKLSPIWDSAIRDAAVEYEQRYPSFHFNSTHIGVRQWNATNAARFVTNATTQQIEGLRAVIKKVTELDGMNVNELARVIRPMVGLYHQQTIANLNFYQKLLDNGVSEKVAREKSIRYSARQHRYRAQMIARTELAFSWNHGKFESVKQCQSEGLMGKCRKVWITADIERTCDFCAALDMKEIEMDEDFPIQTSLRSEMVKKVPPAHPHCMCVVNYEEYEPPEVDSDPLEPEQPEAQQPTPDTPEEEKPLYEFTPASSIQEANDYAKNVLGIPNADYKGTSVEIANEWNKGLADNFSRFPELAENFDFVGTCQNRNKVAKKELYPYVMDRFKRLNPGYTEKQLEKAVKQHITKKYAQPISSSVYAQSSKIGKIKGVTISDKWQGEKFLASIKEDVVFKFHPQGCDTVRSILDHEIGHQIDDLLDLWDNVEIAKLYRSMTPGEMTNALSRYAWDNGNSIKEREFVAEAWSEYVNNPEPREVARKVGEIIEEEYRKFKLRNA